MDSTVFMPSLFSPKSSFEPLRYILQMRVKIANWSSFIASDFEANVRFGRKLLSNFCFRVTFGGHGRRLEDWWNWRCTPHRANLVISCRQADKNTSIRSHGEVNVLNARKLATAGDDACRVSRKIHSRQSYLHHHQQQQH